MSEQETRKRAERIGEQYTRRGIPVITTEETIAEVKKIGFLTAEETLLNRVIELEAEVSRLTQERDEALQALRLWHSVPRKDPRVKGWLVLTADIENAMRLGDKVFARTQKQSEER